MRQLLALALLLAPLTVAKMPPDEFRARRWLSGGHRQTLGSFFLPRRLKLPRDERLIEVEPGVSVLCHCHWQPERTRALTVIAPAASAR